MKNEAKKVETIDEFLARGGEIKKVKKTFPKQYYKQGWKRIFIEDVNLSRKIAKVRKKTQSKYL